MHRIHKPITLGLLRIGAVVGRSTQQPGRHAGPGGEDNKGDEVAGRHGPPALLVELWRQASNFGTPPRGRHALGADALQLGAGAGGGQVEEDGKEEDTAWDVDEGVCSVGPVNQGRVRNEPLLDGTLEKDVEALLEVDELQGVASCNVDGALVDENDRAERSC